MKVFSKLSLIRENEWKDFEKFASSPYFNNGRDYIPLINFLKKFYPEFNSEDLTGENIYKKLYKGKDYNENVIKTVISGLSKITEDFFLYQNFRANQNRDIRLLNEYIKRGDEKRAGKFTALLESEIKKSPSGSMDFFEKLDKIDALQLYYAMNYDKRKRYTALSEGIKNLIYFTMMQSFVFKKEILLYDQRYSEQEFNTTLPGKLLEAIDFNVLFKIIEKEDPGSFIILKIYYLIMKQFSDTENDNYYFEIKKLLSENKDKLEPDNANRLLLNLMSVCNMKSNSGKKEFLYESFQIMKQLVEANYFENTHGMFFFPPSHFRNIVKAGIAEKETEWVKNFVTSYAPKLEHSQSEPLKNYSLSKISFAEKKFDEALNFLGKVNTENLIFKLDIKKLNAMIYFETGSFVNLHSLLNAYYQSVSIKIKKNENIFNRHRNFIGILRKLENIINGNRNYSELITLEKNLEKENVSDKNWLREKITEAEHILKPKTGIIRN
ncbi:MAG TPA: hypothetical protein PKD83_11125 [Ignavibacteria bacterium]|nr:hypothetical protein [Ignavibacteria bacterium]